MKQLSLFISSIFQPLLMPLYSVSLLFIYTHFKFIYANQFLQLTVPTVLFSFLIPGLLIYLLFKLGLISSLSLLKRSDRFAPYTITMLSYSYLIFHFYRLGLPSWFLMMLGSSIIVMILATIITLWWKVSAHMFGISSLIGGVMAVSFFVEQNNPLLLFALLFVIAGLVGTSRLILKRHTPGQVYVGFLLGFIVSFTCVWAAV